MTIQNKNIIKISDEYGVEQEVYGMPDNPINSDKCLVVSEEQIELLTDRVSKTKDDSKKSKHKSSRCKDTVDWVEVEYGDAYEKPCVNKEHYVNKKPKQSSQSFEQSISSTLVKQLTKSEIESLRQNKRDAYELMMKMN